MQPAHKYGMHLNLKAFRRNRGLTQEAMAEAMDVEQSNISRFENGKVHPSLETLYHAADFFECGVGEFFEPKQSEKINPTAPDQTSQPSAPQIVERANAGAATDDPEYLAVALSVETGEAGEQGFLLSEDAAVVLEHRLREAILEVSAIRRKRSASAVSS